MKSDNKITDQNGFEQYPKINYDNKETFESYIEKWKKRNKSNACMYDYIKQLHDQEIQKYQERESNLGIELLEKDKQISELNTTIYTLKINQEDYERHIKELQAENEFLRKVVPELFDNKIKELKGLYGKETSLSPTLIITSLKNIRENLILKLNKRK